MQHDIRTLSADEISWVSGGTKGSGHGTGGGNGTGGGTGQGDGLGWLRDGIQAVADFIRSIF